MDMTALGAMTTAGVEHPVEKAPGHAGCAATSWLFVNANSGWRLLLAVH